MNSTTQLVPAPRSDNLKRHLGRLSYETILTSIISLALQIYIYISSCHDENLFSMYKYPSVLLFLGCVSGVLNVFTGICGLGLTARKKKAATLIPCLVSAISGCFSSILNTYFSGIETWSLFSVNIEQGGLEDTPVVLEGVACGLSLSNAIGSALVILFILLISCQKQGQRSVDTAPIVESQMSYIDAFQEQSVPESVNKGRNQPQPNYANVYQQQPALMESPYYTGTNVIVPELQRDQVRPFGQMSPNVVDYQPPRRGGLAQLHNQRQSNANFKSR